MVRKINITGRLQIVVLTVVPFSGLGLSTILWLGATELSMRIRRVRQRNALLVSRQSSIRRVRAGSAVLTMKGIAKSIVTRTQAIASCLIHSPLHIPQMLRRMRGLFGTLFQIAEVGGDFCCFFDLSERAEAIG